jgi:hypothetical protein
MAKQLAPYTMSAYLSGAWVDITSDVSQPARIVASWGIRGNGPTDYLAQTGSLTFSLKNSTGKYSPNGPAALSGWAKGVPVKLSFVYDGETYIRFRGMVDNIGLRYTRLANENFVSVTVLDWMEYSAKYPMISPSSQADKRANQALNTIVSAMPIPPQAISFDTGLNVFPAVFDSTMIDTVAYSEFAKLTKSESGYIYARKNKADGECLTFESNNYRNGLRTVTTIPLTSASSGKLLQENGNYLLTEAGDKILLSQTAQAFITQRIISADLRYGDMVENYVKISAYPKKVDKSPRALYSLSTPMPIGTGEVINFRALYTDPTGGGARVNAITSTMLPPDVAGAVDPKLSALLHFNGTAGSTTITDESGKAWTAFNGASISTTYSKLGGGVLVLSGTNEYITTPSHADFEFGSGDFTVEWFEFRSDAVSGDATMARDATSTHPAFIFGYSDGANLLCYMSSDGANWDIANGVSMGPLALSAWVHYAVVRSGNTFYIFRDGQIISQWLDSRALFANSNPMSVGRTANTNYVFSYVDELRIQKRAVYTEKFNPTTIQFTAPLQGDYLMNTLEDGSGTDITASLVITASYGAEAVVYSLTNNANTAGFITFLQARGLGIYQYNPVEVSFQDASSVALYGYQGDSLDQQYQRDLVAGTREAKKILFAEKMPRTDLKSVTLCANKDETDMQMFLNLDIGDVVVIVETFNGISGSYFIQSVKFDVTPGGNIWFTYGAREMLNFSGGGLSFVGAQLTAASNQAIDYGYLPNVYSAARSYSFWMKADADVVYYTVIVGVDGDHLGCWRVSWKNQYIRLIRSYSDAGYWNIGEWRTSNPVTTGAWHHVVITQDNTILDTQDPIIYIDGASVAISEDSTPAGTLLSEENASFVIGNSASASSGYGSAFPGTVEDVRVYNRVITAAEVGQIYAEGATGESVLTGLTFQGPAVRTKVYSYFLDHTVVTGDRVTENIFGNIGTPNGAPTIRAIA